MTKDVPDIELNSILSRIIAGPWWFGGSHGAFMSRARGFDPGFREEKNCSSNLFGVHLPQPEPLHGYMDW